MIKSLTPLVLVFAFSQAHATAVNITKKEKISVSEVKEEAANVFFPEEKPYNCDLEGEFEDKSWWSGRRRDVEVNVEATSLQNAMELALTPWVRPTPADRVVKILVEKRVYLVKTINCKPIERSI